MMKNELALFITTPDENGNPVVQPVIAEVEEEMTEEDLNEVMDALERHANGTRWIN